MNDIQAAINSKLQLFVGAEMCSAGRAVGLLWFLFTRNQDLPNQETSTSIQELKLHVQCAWRITQGNVILVASSDRFYPKGDPHQDIEGFDWTTPFVNRCDERIALLFSDKQYKDWKVSSARVDNVGGFELRFSKGRRLQIFPDDSLGEEYWRFIGDGTNQEHFVVTGNGILFE
ncbi:MAG: hypothetical protein HC822_10385 [Oscillochloris sp.]|nr:hypothetical protein [Oscillochloris sp.]